MKRNVLSVLWFIFLLLVVPTVLADVVINEVMYNPSIAQADDTDLEWVELYNTGSSAVDLTAWTLDGNNFDDVTIGAGEYLIVARELVDLGDADDDSFE